VAGQLSGTRNRLAQNIHYFFVRQFIVRSGEQHEQISP
jgi:hypothetical protein